MISTIISDNIPETWIFENYCNLNEKLTGQSVRIKSIYNPLEKTPSMIIYYKNNHYQFHDFSSGKSGLGINLVMDLFDISLEDAHRKIKQDYNKQNNNKEEPIYLENSSFQVSSFKTRNWNELDARYWLQYNIGSSLLNKYNVKPLEYYIISKDEKSYTNSHSYIYGYFSKDGTLYKIYQPKKLKLKFLTVQPFVQGIEQLNYKESILIITSALKDLMSLMSLNLKVESVAPSSENTYLSKSLLTTLLFKYDKVYTLFDNDEAGQKAMLKYKEMYNINSLYLNLSKDLSDSIKDYGPKVTKNCLIALIQ